MIKINSLQKYFNRGKQNEIHVIDGISLDLPERGMVAIFGRSGCGKTTLLNVIGGLDSYLSGSVEIGSEKITPDSDALRNRHIGYIFQNYNLNTGVTCFDNVADALRLCGMSDKKDGDAIRERTMSALSAVGMAQYASRYPDTLSGGQKQRIAIARAIVKSPSIILADEPTGNLDETNTVMIMDILREIAETRLVLLVTHEANLVDSYCDRVIGLTDGRVTSVKDNDTSSGYVARNKNHIYLGEYEKTSADSGSVSVDYYGDPIEKGVKLTIVNDGGKYYLRVDTPGVQIIDDYGETQLHEGTFEKKEKTDKQSRLDLSLLAPFEGKNYGKLFSFFSSLKSGSRILTGKKIRRGKKVLKTSNFFAASYLIVFALVFTILLSYCASGIAVYDSIASGSNRNMFYLSLSEIDQAMLAEAIEKDEVCVDFYYSSRYLNMSGQYLRVSTGVFETFEYTNYDSYRADVQLLPQSLIKNSSVIAGSTDTLEKTDVVLSRAAADAILSTATYEYISEYEDLINCELSGMRYTGGSNTMRIAAIVESDDRAAYYNDMTLARTLSDDNRLSIAPASAYGLTLENGEALIGGTWYYDYTPEVGEKFKISGIEVTASHVAINQYAYTDYATWLQTEGLVTEGSGSHYEKLEDYYSYLPDYAMFCLLGNNDFPWLASYFMGGNEDALLLAAGNLEYFAACKYREEHGAFPEKKLSDFEISEYEQSFYLLERECSSYHVQNWNYDIMRGYPTMVYLSDDDYLNAMFGFGETHPAALADYSGENDKIYGSSSFLVLHSTDPDATEAFLRSEFPELPPNNFEENPYEFVTPALMIEMAVSDSRIVIIASVAALGVGLALMCVCIYFIMRSSMLSKVREIGIHRAVGVSKKNLLFKFAVESTAIALQTLLVGFAVGAYFANTLASGGVTASSFYFPFWLGALTLIFLIGTCILFGILPIASLLRKTPAQILAKYDI